METINLWTYKYEIDETVVRFVLTWDPKVDEEAKKYLPARVTYPGITLKTYAVKLKKDISVPYLKQPIFFTSVVSFYKQPFVKQSRVTIVWETLCMKNEKKKHFLHLTPKI